MRQIVRLSFAVAATVVAAGSLFAVPAWDYRVESITIPKGSYFDTGYCPGEHPYAWVKFTTVPGSVPFGTLTKADGAFMLIHSSDKKLYYRYGRKDSEGATAAYEANQVLSVACYEQMLVNGEKKSGVRRDLPLRKPRQSPCLAARRPMRTRSSTASGCGTARRSSASSFPA